MCLDTENSEARDFLANYDQIHDIPTLAMSAMHDQCSCQLDHSIHCVYSCYYILTIQGREIEGMSLPRT